MSMTRTFWTEDYRVLVLRDPQEEQSRQFLAILLERNVVGQGASIAHAISSMQDEFATDYSAQLSLHLARPKNDPDRHLMACFRNASKRTTSDGEEVLMRLNATVKISFDLERAKEKPAFVNVGSGYSEPEPSYEFSGLTAVG